MGCAIKSVEMKAIKISKEKKYLKYLWEKEFDIYDDNTDQIIQKMKEEKKYN